MGEFSFISDLIHDPAGDGSGFPRGGTVAPAVHRLHYGCDHGHLDMFRGRDADRIYLPSQVQFDGFKTEY